jgi:hypothetical protein
VRPHVGTAESRALSKLRVVQSGGGVPFLRGEVYKHPAGAEARLFVRPHVGTAESRALSKLGGFSQLKAEPFQSWVPWQVGMACHTLGGKYC